MATQKQTSTEDNYVDVLIIGAGPAGLMTSLWLAELGVKYRIIDKSGTRTLHGRADGIHVRSMEILESFGLVDTVLEHGCSISEWCLWSPDEVGDLCRKQRRCALGTAMSRFNLGTMHQGYIEATMIEGVRRRFGAEVERGTTPTAIDVDDNLLDDNSAYPVKVEVRRLQKGELESRDQRSHVKKADGTNCPIEANAAFSVFPKDHCDIVNSIAGEEGTVETIFAKYVVGADGAQSWVRQNIGLELVRCGNDAVWGVIDIHPISDFPDIRKTCTVQSEAGTLLIIPREKGLVRIYVIFTEQISKDPALSQILERAKSIMHPFQIDYHICDWWTVYKPSPGLCDTFSCKDRVYLVGDAAHTHTPKGGQGLNMSIQDAYNIGWKVGLVVKGYVDKRILSTYERERQPIAETLIEMDTEVTHAMSSKTVQVTVEDTQRLYQRLRDYGSGVNIRYRPSALTFNQIGPPSTNLQVGKRFPSLPVFSQATGMAVEMQQLLKSDGRWRLMVFAGAVSKHLQLQKVNEVGGHLANLLKMLPKLKDGSSLLDILLVHASPASDVEITDFHNTFFSFDPDKGYDYDRIFTRIRDGPHEGEQSTTHAKHGISFATSCLVLMRPDQHIGWMGWLDECDMLESHFEGFILPPRRAPTSVTA